MGSEHHRHEAEGERTATCAILTVTDSRTLETDESGKLALEILGKFAHEVALYRVIANDASEIRAALKESFRQADFVVTVGGTGPSLRDRTIEAVRPFVEKELPGFGEMFRSRSAATIGTAALMSRALLGITEEGKIVACVPGSPDAVRLSLGEILMDELKHLLREVRRYR